MTHAHPTMTISNLVTYTWEKTIQSEVIPSKCLWGQNIVHTHVTGKLSYTDTEYCIHLCVENTLQIYAHTVTEKFKETNLPVCSVKIYLQNAEVISC